MVEKSDRASQEGFPYRVMKRWRKTRSKKPHVHLLVDLTVLKIVGWVKLDPILSSSG